MNKLRHRGPLPVIAGAAGWANAQSQSSKAAVVGTTGASLAFGSNVVSGQLIVAASQFSTGTTLTPTFTDTQSNVTSWTTSTIADATTGANVAIAWGVATSSAACTPKVTWNSASSVNLTLYIGSFNTPGGTVSADGAAANDSSSGSHGNQATVTWPPGNGVGSNDLLVNITAFGGGWTSYGGSWTGFGTNHGDAGSYLLNAAGNSSPNSVQSPASTWVGLTIALQASSTTPVPPLTYVAQAVKRASYY